MSEIENAVKQQYEAFPYPPPASASETGALQTGSPSHILEIDHFVFGGKRDWAQPFRALIAGGGIGNAAVMLAQQCAVIGCPAEIVYLDLSTASRKIAEDRAQKRGLTNIAFHTGSLLDVAAIAPGPYDYIDCCGVLHHLPDPGAGLAALNAVLEPGGGMGLMLYGQYGRTGLYEVQSLMRDIAGPRSQAEQLPVLKALLNALPDSHRLVRNVALSHSASLPDEELVDRYLHPQDRAYTVPEIVDFLAGSEMTVAGFLPPGRYDPDTYVDDPALREHWANLDALERASVAERLCGNIETHIFYAVRSGHPVTPPLPRTQLVVPVFKTPPAPETIARINDHTVFTAHFGGVSLPTPAGPLAKEILERIDGKASLGDIYFDIRASARPDLDWMGFLAAFRLIYRVFHGLLNALFLRQ